MPSTTYRPVFDNMAVSRLAADIMGHTPHTHTTSRLHKLLRCTAVGYPACVNHCETFDLGQSCEGGQLRSSCVRIPFISFSY